MAHVSDIPAADVVVVVEVEVGNVPELVVGAKTQAQPHRHHQAACLHFVVSQNWSYHIIVYVVWKQVFLLIEDLDFFPSKDEKDKKDIRNVK